jgi:hypothetical protein
VLAPVAAPASARVDGPGDEQDEHADDEDHVDDEFGHDGGFLPVRGSVADVGDEPAAAEPGDSELGGEVGELDLAGGAGQRDDRGEVDDVSSGPVGASLGMPAWVSRCRVSRRAEDAMRAGTPIRGRRMVALVARASCGPLLAAAARVRLKAITASTSQAAFVSSSVARCCSPGERAWDHHCPGQCGHRPLQRGQLALRRDDVIGVSGRGDCRPGPDLRCAGTISCRGPCVAR